jgi:hypothetical protein
MKRRVKTLCVALCLGLNAGGVNAFFAAAPSAAPPSAQTLSAQKQSAQKQSAAPRDLLERVLSSGDFGGESKGWGIRFKEKKGEQKKSATPASFNFPNWMPRVKDLIGLALAIALGSALLIGLFFLIRYFRKGGSFGLSRKALSSSVRPSASVSAEAPDALLAQAQGLYGGGRKRQAWALWLEATLRAYAATAGLEFPEGATEFDCVSLAGSRPEPRFMEFSACVNIWVRLAYAGYEPPDQDFTRALAFAQGLLMEKGASHA